MNKLFKTVVSVVTASTMALSAMSTFAITASAEDKGAVAPTYDEVIEAVERANDYYQTTVKYNQQEYGIPNSFWHKGAYETGNMEVYYTTGIEAYRNYAEAWASSCSWKGHTSTAPANEWTYGYSQTLSDKAVLFGDFQICFQTYIDLYNVEKAESYGKTVDSNKVARALEVMGYEADNSFDGYWWWADSLYMVMPVMTKLYKLTGDQKYLDKLYVQFKYAKELMYDGPGGIPANASGYTTTAKLSSGASYMDPDNYAYLFFRDAGYVYPLKPNSGHESEKNFWARGDGWVFAGLAKVLQDMPDDYEHYDEFYNTYMEMAPAIRDCMVTDNNGYGFWTQSMLQNYPTSNENPYGYETSGTAFFVYGFAWGINSGLLPKDEYYETTIRAWNYLEHIALQDDGLVGYIQYIGSNATKAMTKSDTQNFGVGAYLLAGCEVSRLVGGVQGDMQPYLQKKLIGTMSLRVGSPHYYFDDAVGHVFEDDHNTTVYLKDTGDGYATAMLPARPIVEKFGGTVDWDEAAQTVTAKIGDRTVVFTVGSKDILVNGVKSEAPVATEITNNRTFVPIRALCESLGKKVYWNDCGDASKGVIVIGEKAAPFYSCDQNLVLMLQELLGTNRAEGHNFKARPEQPEKSFVLSVKPLTDETRIQASKIQASSEPESDHTALKASDGSFDENSRWATDENGGNITFTYEDAVEVGQVALTFWKPTTRTTSYKLEYSTDGSTWTQVYYGASTLGQAQEVFAIDKTVKAFRVSGYGNSENSWFSLIEFAVYKPGVTIGTAQSGNSATAPSSTTSATATGTKITLSAANATFSQQPEAANPGSNVFDGNASTVWASEGSANVVIDLGASADVTCVGVQFKVYEDSRTIPYSIAVSDDKSTWTTVYTGSSVAMSSAFAYATVGKKARYVKCQFEGNTTSGWNSIAEIEVYSGDISSVATATATTTTTSTAAATSATATGTKISLSAASATFSQQPEAANPGSNIFDSNASTVWSSQGSANVVLDLGASTDISCVGVQFKVYEDARTIPYSIAVSDDKSTWTTIYTGNSVAMSSAFAYVTVGKKARYVKCQFEGNTTSGWNSVAEIEVYKGTVAASAATATTTVSSTATAGNTYRVSAESGVYLESPGSNLTASAKSDSVSQKWLLLDAGGGYFALKNSGNGQSLDVGEESTSAGAGVITWDYKSSDNQLFSLEQSGDGYLIKMKHSGLYLTYNTNGSFTQEYRNEAKAQVFTFEKQ